MAFSESLRSARKNESPFPAFFFFCIFEATQADYSVSDAAQKALFLFMPV